jgi:hypothetical protein
MNIAKAVVIAAIALAPAMSSASASALYLRCTPEEKIQWDAIAGDPARIADPHQVTLDAAWAKPVRYRIQVEGEDLAWSSSFGARSLRPLVPCVPDGCRRSSDFYTFVDMPGASGMEDRISINRKTGEWDALQTGRIEIKGRCAMARAPRIGRLANRF